MPSSTSWRAKAFEDRTHRAYHEVLGSGIEQSSDGWRMAAAGFLTLRFIDHWFEAVRPISGPAPRYELAAVESAIASAPEGAQKEGLKNLVRIANDTWGSLFNNLLVGVFAYGQLLQKEEAYAFAVDFYNSFLAFANWGDRDIIPDAYYRLGECLRKSGQLEAAPMVYEIAHQLALDLNDTRVRFLSKFGLASILVGRGAFVDAEVALHLAERDLDELPAGQHEGMIRDLRARARHDHGTVAYYKRQYVRAALFFHDALKLYDNAWNRERLIGDLATNFIDLGMRDAARDALQINYLTACGSQVRQGAAINLLQLAALEGEEMIFETYRRELATMSLSRYEEAHYQLYVAEGCYGFGRSRCAHEACSKVLGLAKKHGFSELLNRAETLRQKMIEGVPPRGDTPPSVTVPANLEGLVETIRQMRALAEASAQ